MMNSSMYLPFSGNPSDGATVFFLLLALLVVVLWIWSLVDVLKRHYRDNTEKLIWVFVVVSTFFLGTILYYLLGKKNSE